MSAPPAPLPRPHAPENDDAELELFDYGVVRDWGRFVLGAFGRHRLLGFSCLIIVMSGAIGAAAFLPRKYESSTKLLTHQTGFMTNLSNPYRGGQEEGATRAARERVLARDNLEKIVTQTNLVEEWQKSRNPLLGTKDKMLQAVFGKWSREDWNEILVGTMEQRLAVSADEGTVEIKIAWPEPRMARLIVETAQQNFLEQRHVSEVAAISETIHILETHATQTQTSIDEALANLQRVIDERSGASKRPAPAPAPSPSPSPRPVAPRPEPAAGPSAEVVQLKFMLRAKQRAITDLDDFRQRQLTELRNQLEQQRVIYNKSHPVILELEQRLESLQKDSPQMLTLKREEQDLMKELQAKGGDREENPREASSPLPVRRTPTAMETSLQNIAPDLERDPTVTVAQDQLRVALARYQELLMRVEAARLELDTARAAFKYRFSVVRPALTPRKPTAPNVPMILIAGLLAGIVLSFVACAGLDLWRRAIVDSWQIERQLKVAVLAIVKLPKD
ncbi:MAG: hypothetical protein JNK82_12080 [Myxococcaceae bacterium]|nr:hypothetical protein [Myxococcaceae bacterium]